MKFPTSYRTTQIDGLSIFYREAGPKDAPTLLLLHGLPSSSRMFEPLFTRLSDRYHLVAPDYPGFGHSDWPDPKTFAYTFDHYAEIMNHFTEALGLSHYTLYMQDYGGPVGFRMALAHPERVAALAAFLLLVVPLVAFCAWRVPTGAVPDEPTHVMMREVAHQEPFRKKLSEAARVRDSLPKPGIYYDALKPHCARLDIWHTIYNHVMNDAAAIVEWVKGTGLRPFLDPLELPERKLYLAEYTARVAASYLPQADGKVLLRFPRIFFVAVR